jgi:EmrB/QacA subfamily drug resistance transporter
MTTPSRRGPDPAPSQLDNRPGPLLAVLVLASFMVVLDYAGAIILLPSILADLAGSLDEATWVVAAFVLTFAVLFLPAAGAAERWGRRRLFLCGVAVFTLASLAAALAPSLRFLVGVRVLQGAGAAMIEPAVFALIKAAVPRERQQWAFGVQGGAFLLGAALGPILPGALATAWSWRYLFWLNVLLGTVIALSALRVLPRSRPAAPPRSLDVPGAALGAAALFGFFFAVIEGPRLGWTSVAVIGTFTASVVASVLFLTVEARVANPLVDLRLFGNRTFTIGNAARAATEFTSLGVFLPLSHFLQVQLGHSPLVAGLLLMSVIGGALVTAALAERVTGRLDARWLMVPGFVLAAAGIFWVAHVSPATGWGFFIAPLAVAGAGIGALEGPAENAVRHGVPPARSDAAWRVSYASYLLGIGLGVAVVSSVWRSASGMGAAAAVNTALLSCVAVALLAAVITCFLGPDPSSGAAVQAHRGRPPSEAARPRT